MTANLNDFGQTARIYEDNLSRESEIVRELLLPILKETINRSSVELDSLKIRIPIENVEVIHPDLKDNFMEVNKETGEEKDIGQKKNYQHIGSDGIKFTAKIEGVNTSWDKRENFLTLGVSSKMLGGNYFDGLTFQNWDNVYDYIHSTGIVNFSSDSFFSSETTDIDFKCDFNLDCSFSEFTKVLSECSKYSQKKKIGKNRFDQKENKGIEFQSRANTQSILSRPFLKLYSKRTELIYRSRDFYQSYLVGQEIPEIRAETTIKNRKHQKHVGIDDNRLGSLFLLPQNKKKEILIDAIEKNIDKSLLCNVKVNPKLCTKDKYIHYHWNYSKLDDLDADIERFSQLYRITKKQKFDLKKRLKLIHSYVN